MTPHLTARLGAISLALLMASAAARADEPLVLTGSATGAVVGSTEATLTLTFETASALSLIAVNFQFSWDGAGLIFNRNGSTFLGTALPDLVAMGGLGEGETEEGNTFGSYGLSSFLSLPLNLAAGTQTLTLKFDGLSAGSFPVKTDLIQLIDDQGIVFTSTELSTPITVSAVPEPEPALLLLAGLACLGWLGRRRAA
ncbi:PEP-CTERM sorting domain-containing protein [Roseateles sp. LYH14W]|uniref:PEP-CTERM sorting domain-containing protein n=1 Tax=Pelomonas parva TaxID=3299032 RepID=A0ABW7EZD2_9BURK